MRRRVKEQLKKLGGMEFYDVNFSYIDNESFEEHYVSVPSRAEANQFRKVWVVRKFILLQEENQA